MGTHHISSEGLTIELLGQLIEDGKQLALSKGSRQRIQRCRDYLDHIFDKADRTVYGVNTGFGSLCKVKISLEQTSDLQQNLLRSHACGLGDVVPEHLVRIMLILKAQSLSYGHSGVAVKTVERLLDFFNEKVTPVVYEQGSLGASGDLAPLSHLCLPLIGEGEVLYQGKIRKASDVLKEKQWNVLTLESKEGLALINGTQFMSAYGVWAILEAERLNRLADFIGAVSTEARFCKTEHFNPLIHKLRNQKGQIETARNIMEILEGSEIAAAEKKQVQDSYSFRCIPQVHGASKDVVAYCKNVLTSEINAVTDNPNIFVEEDMVLSGGNFHGQPLAFALDFLAIALAELANISERRTYRLLSGERMLPEFLNENSGLNSGLMIPQYAAASMVSQNKQLCHPASVDSIPSSNEQEDHVSMGANAATKAIRVVENTEKVLAIEFLTAAQAVDFRRPLKSSPAIAKVLDEYRSIVPFNTKDRLMYKDIEKTVEFVRKL